MARMTGVDQMQPVDLIACGSVAGQPTRRSAGQGVGYSDVEVALLQEAGLIGPDTTIVTTVHPLQVVDEDLPRPSTASAWTWSSSGRW